MAWGYGPAGENPAKTETERNAATDNTMLLRRWIGLNILLLPTLVSLLAGAKTLN